MCTSVNEVICHGIPDQRELQNGDIVNVDVTAYLKGYHGDLNETFTVGERERALYYSFYIIMLGRFVMGGNADRSPNGNLRETFWQRSPLMNFQLLPCAFQVGEVDDEGKAVIRVAHDCLMKV